MTTFFHYGDSVTSPEMLHEVGETVPDPLLFLEHGGRRIIGCGPFEISTFETREDLVDELVSYVELGVEDLTKDQSFPQELIGAELALRALRRFDLTSVSVPGRFPVFIADHLRANGIEVGVDPKAWALRRRHKTAWEIEGIERAQRAADTAMLTAARMLKEAERTRDGELRFEGEILTSELIREAMIAELLAQGAESDLILVQSGDACLTGHDPGSGPIQVDTSLVIDCFPRDRRTGAFTDMTRTFVPGEASAELRNLHGHVRKALDVAFDSIKPGAADVYQRVAEYFHSEGFPTQTHHEGDGVLEEGFMHALGHGVGLEVHERPTLGRRAEPLIEGEVIAVEPGLYFRGIGGVRLEDTVLVTDGGIEHFTDPFPYDLEP
jgi:Xaa-Pro aminopeptidase